jgi:hypothetical protein
MIDRKFHRLQLSAAVGYDELVLPVKSFSLFHPISGIKGTTIFHFQNHTGRQVLILYPKMLFCLGSYHETDILLFLLLLTDGDEYHHLSSFGVFSFNVFMTLPLLPIAQLIIIFSCHSILFSVLYVGLSFKSSMVFHHKPSLAQLTIKILSGC